MSDSRRERKRMFVTVDESLDGGVRQRVMVVWHKGEPMMVARWTQTCSGCTEYSEGQLLSGPMGCHECGYTGKCRHAVLVPLPEQARKEAFRKRAQQRSGHDPQDTERLYVVPIVRTYSGKLQI